jgi:hypothetical protein
VRALTTDVLSGPPGTTLSVQRPVASSDQSHSGVIKSTRLGRCEPVVGPNCQFWMLEHGKLKP